MIEHPDEMKFKRLRKVNASQTVFFIAFGTVTLQMRLQLVLTMLITNVQANLAFSRNIANYKGNVSPHLYAMILFLAGKASLFLQ